MSGKRPLRRAIRQAQRFANFTGKPQRVVRDNLNGHYRVISHIPQSRHYGILVNPK